MNIMCVYILKHYLRVQIVSELKEIQHRDIVNRLLHPISMLQSRQRISVKKFT